MFYLSIFITAGKEKMLESIIPTAKQNLIKKKEVMKKKVMSDSARDRTGDLECVRLT